MGDGVSGGQCQWGTVSVGDGVSRGRCLEDGVSAMHGAEVRPERRKEIAGK